MFHANVGGNPDLCLLGKKLALNCERFRSMHERMRRNKAVVLHTRGTSLDVHVLCRVSRETLHVGSPHAFAHCVKQALGALL